MELLKYLGYGWLVLVAAIMANGVVKALGGTTWYDYIVSISRHGLIEATLTLHPLEIFFLFIIYPGIFGTIAFLAVKLS